MSPKPRKKAITPIFQTTPPSHPLSIRVHGSSASTFATWSPNPEWICLFEGAPVTPVKLSTLAELFQTSPGDRWISSRTSIGKLSGVSEIGNWIAALFRWRISLTMLQCNYWKCYFQSKILTRVKCTTCTTLRLHVVGRSSGELYSNLMTANGEIGGRSYIRSSGALLLANISALIWRWEATPSIAVGRNNLNPIFRKTITICWQIAITMCSFESAHVYSAMMRPQLHLPTQRWSSVVCTWTVAFISHFR